MKKLFTFALALLGFTGVANAASVDDLPVCKHSYVLVGDDWTNNGLEKIAKGALFGNGFFFTPTGHDKATNKGNIDLSTVDELGIVTQEIVDKYAEYGSHLNSLRLKAAQDVMALKVTALSKLIIFYEKNKDTDNRYPIVSKTADMKEPLSSEDDVQVKGAYGNKQCGRLEWTATDDGLIYIGAENQIFVSYIIVEAKEAPGTPSVKVGEQTYENGLWFREVTCKAVPATEEGSDEKIATVVTYTTNGMDPTASSELYTGPIKCYEDMTVKFQAFYDFTNGGKADDENLIDGADNEAIVSFQFDAPTITAEGGNVTITSPYEGATNYATLDGDLENAEEKSSLTLNESATVTAFSKIVNGEYTTFTTKTATKDVYVLDPIKEKKVVTVTDGEVVVDEEATAQSTTGETVYTVANGVISADKKDFFVKDLAYGVVKDAAYQIDDKEMYIKMSTTNITFQVAEGDSVNVKVICSKNSCKNIDADDNAEDPTAFVNDRKCYVNVSGTNYFHKDANGDEASDVKLCEDANIIEFGLPAGTWTFQKYSGTGNILISSIEIAPATESAPDAAELVAPEGWTKAIVNGNLASTDVTSFISKEAPSTTPVGATIVDGAGKDGSRGIVVKSLDEPSQAWDTQFWIKLDEALPAGTKLHVQFDYMASKAAKASTQAHGNPGAYQHWACIGDVNFTTEWQTYSTDIEVSSDMATGSGGNGLLSIAFNLSEEKTATEYRFDNFGVWYQKPAPVAEWADLIVNGNMEENDTQCFYATEQGVGGPFRATITSGIGKDGGSAIKVQSADEPANDWATQFFIRVPYQVPAGTKFKLSFDYRADVAGQADTQCHNEPGQYIHYACAGSPNFTTEWQSYEYEGTIPSQCDGSDNNNGYKNTFQTIAFNLAKNKVATGFIFDNVKFEVPKSVVESLTPNPAPIPEDPELVAPEGWTSAISNGNMGGEEVKNYVAKEAPATEPVEVTIVDGAGKNGNRGIVVKSADDPSQAWDTQFWIKLDEALPAGTKLHVQFDYMANKAAKASTQAHGNPGAYQHWACIGDVNFTTEWQTYSTDIEVSSDMATGSGGNGLLSIAFNLSEEKTATEYHFDNFGVWYQKPAPVSDWADLIVNGDMEGDDMQCFYATEQGVGGPFVASTTPGIGKDGGKAIKVQSADEPANDWATQFFIRVPYQVPAGTKFRLSFDYKADVAGSADTQCHAEPGQYIHYTCAGSPSFTTEWQSYEYEGTIPSQCDGSDNNNGYKNIFQTIAFNLAKNKVATGFIFDNVKFEVPKSVAESLTPNPSGIETVRITESQNNVRYNLSGVRVNENYKGIVIMNGKKIIQK